MTLKTTLPAAATSLEDFTAEEMVRKLLESAPGVLGSRRPVAAMVLILIAADDGTEEVVTEIGLTGLPGDLQMLIDDAQTACNAVLNEDGDVFTHEGPGSPTAH